MPCGNKKQKKSLKENKPQTSTKSTSFLCLRPRIPSELAMTRNMLKIFDAKIIIPIHWWPKGSIKNNKDYNLQKTGVDKLINEVGRNLQIKGHTLKIDKDHIPAKPIVVEFSKVYRGYLK